MFFGQKYFWTVEYSHGDSCVRCDQSLHHLDFVIYSNIYGDKNDWVKMHCEKAPFPGLFNFIFNYLYLAYMQPRSCKPNFTPRNVASHSKPKYCYLPKTRLISNLLNFNVTFNPSDTCEHKYCYVQSMKLQCIYRRICNLKWLHAV